MEHVFACDHWRIPSFAFCSACWLCYEESTGLTCGTGETCTGSIKSSHSGEARKSIFNLLGFLPIELDRIDHEMFLSRLLAGDYDHCYSMTGRSAGWEITPLYGNG